LAPSRVLFQTVSVDDETAKWLLVPHNRPIPDGTGGDFDPPGLVLGLDSVCSVTGDPDGVVPETSIAVWCSR